MIQTSDGSEVLVCDPFLGFHFKPWEEVGLFGLNEDGADPEDHSTEALVEQVMEGHTPIIQVFPKLEWAMAIVNGDAYGRGAGNTKATMLSISCDVR